MRAPVVCVQNLGCRVNRVESDAIVSALVAEGFCVGEAAEADLVVVNTCAVTGEAEAKTRKAVRRALALPRAPHVVVTGCAVNLHPGELAALSERVVEEPAKAAVARRARELLAPAGGLEPAPSPAPAAPPTEFLGRSRLGVKIQDGCNNRCSYCIVWKARGRERSEPAEAVLEQVRRAAAGGVPEVVLTGVNLAAYRAADGGGAGTGLEGLLARILAETDIRQVRLSSLEPMDLRPALLELMAASDGRIAPYLHLPLQAGSTATLRRMRRPYTAEEYERLAARCRELVPGVAISCDVIVGFPGETEDEFAETRALCERVGFSKMHVFRYSARPGTPAATAPDQVPPPVMAARSAELRALAAEMTRSDAARRVGTVERAVIEDGARATLGSFHRVLIDGAVPEGARAAGIVELAIIGQDSEGLLHGRPVGEDGARGARAGR